MTITGFEKIRVHSLNTSDSSLKEIKFSITSGKNVTDYTFLYRAKAEDTDDTLTASIKKTDSEFHTRLQSLIDLSQAIQENIKGYEKASLQQDAAGNVKIYQNPTGIESENLSDLHRRFKATLAQQKLQNAKLDENVVKVYEAITKYFTTIKHKNFGEGTLSLTSAVSPSQTPPQITVSPEATSTPASKKKKKNDPKDAVPILEKRKAAKALPKRPKKKKPKLETEKPKEIIQTQTTQPVSPPKQ